MRKLILLPIIFVLAFQFGACAAKKEKSAEHASSKYASFKSSADWNKLDGRFKQAWDEAVSKGNEERQFECLIKVKTKLSGADKEKIKGAGFEYRSAIGKILTGAVRAKDVPAVAALKFVEVMELAVPLSPKK